VLQCVGTSKTDDADIFLARAEIAIVADGDSAAIYSAISYMNCVVVKSQEVVVVLMGPGSELEPARCDEVLSGNVYRPGAAAEIVRDREAINI
jgi:hypothetical protein